jgi:hypothetical protein
MVSNVNGMKRDLSNGRIKKEKGAYNSKYECSRA